MTTRPLSDEAITATAQAIVEDLQHLEPLDVSTILTLALSIVLVVATKQSREETAETFRRALLDQMDRLDGRAVRGETSPS